MRPQIVMPVAYSVVRRLSSFVRSVDFAIDWVLLDSGQPVYRSGDVADSIFVVLSGRLRSVENKQIIEEFGRGDVLGMIEVLQRVPRSTTVLAIRFSQLARLPEGLLNFVKMKYPQNLHTIAVVAASPDVPLVAFTCELFHTLSANLRVLRLSSQKIAEQLDAAVLEKFLSEEACDG
ncbi:unnamed protein product [Gongylonema pulchrum]|uniref:Cyclic nucleotide-binding domain-containing protein n=1 Tax=Gongylonema pulchrum TaxID=637853 RepID=A0A183EI48_9BILA|nr:unnamed protein product [Gongylonema pulchrum]VDN36468.1 unnamed protein product [Gongylonema pulchrum]